MKYRIISDIHGRTNWQKLVDIKNNDTTYIFLGDFTDPYYGYESNLSYPQMIDQIEKIFNLKREAPERVIILASNHDLQYWLKNGETNRYDWGNEEEIHKLFKNNEDLFSAVAYSIGEKYLITHAGVTYDWYQAHFDNSFKKGETSLEEIRDNINNLYDSGDEGKMKFTFNACVQRFSDYYGTSPTHSPLWIRPTSLWDANLFGFNSGIIQVVGHTPFEPYKYELSQNTGKIATIGTNKSPMTDEEMEETYYKFYDPIDSTICELVECDPEKVDIILCDCLRIETACVEIDGDTLEWKKIEITKEEKQEKNDK